MTLWLTLAVNSIAFGGLLFLLAAGANFWVAALASGLAMAVIGGGVERLLLRRLVGQELAQVLLTLGLSFIVSDLCLMIWTGDPWQPQAPDELRGVVRAGGIVFP